MRRIHFVPAIMLVLSALIFGYSQSPPNRQSALRRIPVNARTINTLPSGKNYVVDLTQRGVKYEFDTQAGQIDLRRVTVRTARGEVAIGAFLQAGLLRERLAGFRYTSRSFSLATGPANTLGPLTNPSRIISCDNPNYCHCTGVGDCKDLINSKLCGGAILCNLNDAGQEDACTCKRQAE
jgi:hypothetical protein